MLFVGGILEWKVNQLAMSKSWHGRLARGPMPLRWRNRPYTARYIVNVGAGDAGGDELAGTQLLG